MRLVPAALAALGFAAPPAAAENIGWSLAISNDSIGEFLDRWQSSSIQLGLAFGEPWTGRAPAGFGELIEVRFRTDLLTPESLDAPAPDDRRHAGVLAFGLHTHMARGAWDMRVGADLVIVGEQTGLLDVQEELHELLGFTVPELDDFQIEDQETLDLSAEVGREVPVGRGRLRPFVEVQAGSEDIVRAGLDLTFGPLADGELTMRALTTGQRVPMTFSAANGFSWSVGADIAWVGESIYLPEELGYELTPVRQRVRAGAHYKHDRFDVFYGIAWLGEEFEAQPEGQFVGTFQARYDF